MAMKSSKIAVTLQPSLKQKLREYGKENQIKNFSGVILAILDEYLGGDASPSSQPADLWQVINELTARVDQLEGGSATTTASKEKPKKVLKSRTTKPAPAKTKTEKPSAKPASKTSRVDKPAKPSKKTASTRTSTKSAATKSKPTRAVKASSKSAPVKKTKAASTTRRTTTPSKSSKTKSASKKQWMSTREAFEMYGGNLSWSRFSKLTPEELKDRFNLDSDLSRKVRGSRFNQWLTPGK